MGWVSDDLMMAGNDYHLQMGNDYRLQMGLSCSSDFPTPQRFFVLGF
jgi:hypothetical protein